jgi:excinuclease ABC subunit C
MPQQNTPPKFDSKSFLSSVTHQPGIYQMFDADGAILYVGKAKNLKSRLSSYFRGTGLSTKTQSLVTKIARIEVTITSNETDALILEHNLIKSNRPPYNILLRDDKSYPYIFISSEQQYPRIAFHRGSKKKKGDYYGPFPNVGAVRESMNFLQKTFKIRPCEDSVFNNRTRPCLQYQIQRCTAPCVELISPEDYRSDVINAQLFLAGRGEQLLSNLADNMEQAASALQFERAAVLRDQVAALRRVQSQQIIEEGNGDIDVIAVDIQASLACVHILFVRDGKILGSRSYYPSAALVETNAELLAEFLGQFYIAGSVRDYPREIIVSELLEDKDILASALGSCAGRKMLLTDETRGYRSKWLEMAQEAAKQNLRSKISDRQNVEQRFLALQQILDLPDPPHRLECFDISHSSGELTVASCVVFDRKGPLKSDYRRFNIDGITAGDDYAAMEQALRRRYTRLTNGEGKLPDILVIDGGKGQMRKAKDVLFELGVSDVLVLGVAKGVTRKPGFETLIIGSEEEELVLSGDSPALHLIQHIRDESHRFAITGHKQRRDKKRKTSSLEGIPGVGPAKRRELLRHFGGLGEIAKASVDELACVKGISKGLAEEIHGYLHS